MRRVVLSCAIALFAAIVPNLAIGQVAPPCCTAVDVFPPCCTTANSESSHFHFEGEKNVVPAAVTSDNQPLKSLSAEAKVEKQSALQSSVPVSDGLLRANGEVIGAPVDPIPLAPCCVPAEIEKPHADPRALVPTKVVSPRILPLLALKAEAKLDRKVLPPPGAAQPPVIAKTSVLSQRFMEPIAALVIVLVLLFCFAVLRSAQSRRFRRKQLPIEFLKLLEVTEPLLADVEDHKVNNYDAFVR